MEKTQQLLGCDLAARMERGSPAVVPIGCNSVSLAVRRQAEFSGAANTAFSSIFGYRQQNGVEYLPLAFVGPTQLRFSFFLVHY